VSTLVPQGEAAEFELDTLGQGRTSSLQVGLLKCRIILCAGMPSRERAEDVANAHLMMFCECLI